MSKFEDDLRREHLERVLNEELGPVVAIFQVKKIPEGGAPLAIREAWQDLALPVRKGPLERHADNGAKGSFNVATGQLVEIQGPVVPVFGYDAVKTLVESDREEAARYWERKEMALATLAFQASEGELVSLEADEGRSS